MDRIIDEDWVVFTKLRLQDLAADRRTWGAQLRRPFPSARIWTVLDGGDGYVTVSWVPNDYAFPEPTRPDDVALPSDYAESAE